MPDFSHLHVHTQYSLLDGAAPIDKLLKKAKENDMKAMAITDHGNMYGIPKFTATAEKNGVKPIIGCEFYLTDDRFDKKNKVRYHQVLLAKNQKGYENISILCTRGATEGFYYKPRIDKALLREFSEGLIATTCCLAAEVPRAIIQKSEEEAEKVFLEYLDIFGDDYYVELQRHGIEDQNICNEVLIKFAKKHNVKMIATNDVHYVDRIDSEAQDILLCLQTGKDYDDPNRMRFDGDQFYLKTKDEMLEIFKDIPEALDNTMEIVDKIDPPKITRDILMPAFEIPEEFDTEDGFLKHLTFEGCKKKYGELTAEITERADFELKVIKDMGFAGYFLIVQDFTTAAREMGVSVGPGRGSAAGSVVAYALNITNIDPIKYDLLFERFLNPERVSMPDIDIDFDDDGRQRVIDWVVEKHGKDRVAQIITFGTMAAKSAIRDVARVLKLPLHEADKLAKLVPDTPGITLKQAFDEVKELADAQNSSDILIARTLTFAKILEGAARHTGIHAAGVIIAPDNLEKFLPMSTSKGADLLVTQYDGKYVEGVGMLKMDFLGLKTLSIIKDAIVNIKENHGVEIDIDEIPLDDVKTYELYQKGNTVGTFQFESEGMRMYLKELKPTNIEDLIAMNALYRPGPMDFIPLFINRKQGREPIEYPHEMLEGILKNTYGIMVYQEQIMQAAQIMGGFSLGSADLLRRAMGKKSLEIMEEQSKIFIAGAIEKGVDAKDAKSVFDTMAKFAQYGFNRSHSAAYSVVAYQTGYLKANYMPDYMAAVLTRNMNDIKKVAFFMEECKRQDIAVLGPDVNESSYTFKVNKKGEIRFGLGALKGVGAGAVETIVDNRAEGPYKSVIDLVLRIELRQANKKCLESLALAGAFDLFDEAYRSQYFYKETEGDTSYLENLIKFGNSYKKSVSDMESSLFGDSSEVEIAEPVIPDCKPWPRLTQIYKEKDVTGLFLSGHPLDDYALEMKYFCPNKIAHILDMHKYKGRDMTVGCYISEVVHRTTKNGKPFGILTIEDYRDSVQLMLFSEDYLRMRHMMVENAFIWIKGTVRSRFHQEDNLEFKVNSMELLAEVREKKAETITVKVDIKNIDDDFINGLDELMKLEEGKCKVKLCIFDMEDKVSIEVRSRRKGIMATNEFIDELVKMKGVSFDLNK
ncbi:MAG: DNA polymerase III subunit alpha [Flavobacteriales bacterium]|nr:DNA polymerase III subunit alpha [Flavobacteriales bacterium]